MTRSCSLIDAASMEKQANPFYGRGFDTQIPGFMGVDDEEQ
jgi:hypothetical protein